MDPFAQEKKKRASSKRYRRCCCILSVLTVSALILALTYLIYETKNQMDILQELDETVAQLEERVRVLRLQQPTESYDDDGELEADDEHTDVENIFMLSGELDRFRRSVRSNRPSHRRRKHMTKAQHFVLKQTADGRQKGFLRTFSNHDTMGRELGHTCWELDQDSMSIDVVRPVTTRGRCALEIQKTGMYFVYAQVTVFTPAETSPDDSRQTAMIELGNSTIAQCHRSDAPDSVSSSYMARVHQLNRGQTLHVKTGRRSRIIRTDPQETYIGLFSLD